MSIRSWLPVVAVLTLGVALPAFPCEGNPNCTCGKAKSAAKSEKTTAVAVADVKDAR